MGDNGVGAAGASEHQYITSVGAPGTPAKPQSVGHKGDAIEPSGPPIGEIRFNPDGSITIKVDDLVPPDKIAQMDPQQASKLIVGTYAVAVAIALMEVARMARDSSAKERNMSFELSLLSFAQAQDVAELQEILGDKKAQMHITMAVAASVSLAITAFSAVGQLSFANRAANAATPAEAERLTAYGRTMDSVGRMGGSLEGIISNLAQANFAKEEGMLNAAKTIHEAIKEVANRSGSEADKAEKDLHELMRDMLQALQRFWQMDQSLFTKNQ